MLPVVLLVVACACYVASRIPQGVQGQDKPIQLEPVEVDPDLGQKAYEHCDRVVAFGPRNVGSPGWSEALLYIHRSLRDLGLKPVRDRWQDEVEKLNFENIHVTIPGRSKDRIVIGCHHDTKRTQGHDDEDRNFHFVGANDSGSGVGLLLALAEALSKRDNQATIQLVFLDGEESLDWDWNEGARALFGSRRFVKAYKERRLTGQESPIQAFILLDMVGAVDLQIDEESNSDDRLIAIFRAAAVATGHSKLFFDYRGGVSDDHLPFIDARIPAIDLIDLDDNPQWHTAADTMEHISARSLQIVGEVVLTALPEIERQFLPRDR